MATKQWTARRRRALEVYLRKLAPIMKLADWNVKVAWDEKPGGALKELPVGDLANITPIPSSKHAILRVSTKLLDLTAEEQTQALCHELVHCHLFALVELANATFSLLTDGERAVAELALNQHVELTTDALADAFWPMVPRFDADASTTAKTPTGAR